MTILFTSDTHYFHTNIIKYCNRPFPDRLAMNEAMIANWNATVGPDDLVYHLGDFGFCNADETRKILQQLNGIIVLIRGNHDRHLKGDVLKEFDAVHKELMFELDGQFIMLSHYPTYDLDFINSGGWMLHGHCHGNEEPRAYRMLDVGVDSHNFKPITFAEVNAIMNERTGVCVGK